MAVEKRLIDANDVYALFDKSGTARLHVADIDLIPRVDAVEVVHGRWIMYLDGDSIVPDRFYRYSVCCDSGWGRKWPYCPNCGAKMDGDRNG